MCKITGKTYFHRKMNNYEELRQYTSPYAELAKYKVIKEVKLSREEFEQFKKDLIRTRSWLTDLGTHTEEDGVPVVRVFTNSESTELLVDTQGYDYPRYVGLR